VNCLVRHEKVVEWPAPPTSGVHPENLHANKPAPSMKCAHRNLLWLKCCNGRVTVWHMRPRPYGTAIMLRCGFNECTTLLLQ
jgi:hypothetical protein